MEPIVTRRSESQIELFDADGRLIGTVTHPVEAEILGPGREKVYLARGDARPDASGVARADRRSQAA